MLGFEKKLLRNMFFQCHLRTEKWSDFYHIYNKYGIWGLPLVRKGPEPMPPPPHTHTQHTHSVALNMMRSSGSPLKTPLMIVRE